MGTVGAAVEDAVDKALALWRLADYTSALALRVASQLKVADLLSAGPKSSSELAADLEVPVGPLQRLLRALASRGIFAAIPPESYGLTPLADLLRSDHPLSLHDAFQPSTADLMAWSEFGYSVRTGRSAFEHVYGQDHQRYSEEHPDERVRMDLMHRAGTRIEGLTVSRLYDWSTVRTVVDVGGGTGVLLAGLLSRFRRLRAILFELPYVVADAAAPLAAAGVADRCELIGGDFFEGLPAGADVYLLKSVLGAWDDESALGLLRNLRRAMRADSRLLVLEPILGYGAEFTVGNVIHLQTLVLYGGPDRTREEYDRLFEAAGLRIIRVVPRPTLPLIEAVPA